MTRLLGHVVVQGLAQRYFTGTYDAGIKPLTFPISGKLAAPEPQTLRMMSSLLYVHSIYNLFPYMVHLCRQSCDFSKVESVYAQLVAYTWWIEMAVIA